MAQIKSRKKLVAIVTAALLVAGGSTAAFAYWTSTGSTTGTATTGTSVAFDFSAPSITGVETLTPNGGSQVHTFNVSHKNTGAQYLSGVSVAIDSAKLPAGCGAENYTVSATTTPGQIAPNTSVKATVTVAMIETNQNQDACKNAVVPFTITAS